MADKNQSPESQNNSGGGRKTRFPELPPKYSASRELRNKAEKMRRDRLNKLIEEMRSLVPLISNKTKKSDTTRSSILRLTANYLRVTRLFPGENKSEESKSFGKSLIGEGLPHLESLDGFFFILGDDGRILFISENIDKFIGFSQIEMMGFPIFNFTHPGDHAKLRSNLSGKERLNPSLSCGKTSLTTNVPAKLNGSSTSESRGPRQSFYLRLREKPLAKNDKPQYEHMHVVGHLRTSAEKKNSIGQHTFVGVMRPVRDRPITELSLMESIQDQYITRHLPDGRIIWTDHRISTIAGYLPSEVKGKSAFNFFFAEDLPWTTMAMRHMFASTNGEGSTVYRLFTQTGELICLQSKGFLEFNKTTNKIESLLCINKVIRPEDEERYLKEQKERFTPFITEMDINALTNPMAVCQSSMTSERSKISSACPDRFSPSTSAVSVISKVSPNRDTSSHMSNPLKRSASEALNYQDTFPRKQRIGTQQLSPNVNNSNLKMPQLTQKRKFDQVAEDQIPPLVNNWQYQPVREDPRHRTEAGIRIIDVEEPVLPKDPIFNGGFSQDSLTQARVNPILTNHQVKVDNLDGSRPGRVNSVICMLPQRRPVEQNALTVSMPNPELRSPTQNPLDKDEMLAECLKLQSCNPVPLERDIIKEELLNSSSSETERIAEKLQAMLAPYSQQLSQNQRVASYQEGNNEPTYEIQCQTGALPMPSVPPLQNESNRAPTEGDLLAIVNQELIFSMNENPAQQMELSSLQRQLPSTSS